MLRNIFEVRYLPLTGAAILAVSSLVMAMFWPGAAIPLEIVFLIAAILVAIGIHDLTQTRHAILRNYPIAAHLRFMLENVRPELR